MVDAELLNGVKSMYINSLVCVRIKGNVVSRRKVVDSLRSLVNPWTL